MMVLLSGPPKLATMVLTSGNDELGLLAEFLTGHVAQDRES